MTESKLETKTKAKTLDSWELLAAQDILGTDKLQAFPVVTPEWKPGSQVYVAELSADERDQMETAWVEYKEARGEEDNVGFRAFCVAFCLCDAKRYRLFADREETAAAAIGKRNAKATSRIFNTVSRLNGLTKADIDVLEGN